MNVTTEISIEWILSSIGFVAAFVTGLWQYRRAQRQEKIRLLLPLITEFETDAKLQAACQLLDYDDGTFNLKGQEFAWRNSDLLEALKVVPMDTGWSPLHLAMREALDRFFDFIGKLSSFIEIGLIDFKDLRYFYYYFELLTGIEGYKGNGFETALRTYLEAYGFSGCRKCCNLYRQLPGPEREELKLSALLPEQGDRERSR
jgi:hypothetical protein